MVFTTQNLLDSVNRKAFIPSGQNTFTDTEILAIADEEMSVTVLPAIIGVREEYLVSYKDYAITDGQREYAIPPRAVGLAVREVHLVYDSYTTDLPRIDLESVDTTKTGAPTAFYLRNNSVGLDREPTSTEGTLRVYFALRPGSFIASTASAVISAINTTTNVVTVTSIPSSWVTGDDFDFVKQTNGHEYLSIDNNSTLVSGNDITFSSLPSTLAVGDYVMPAGYSSLVQTPVEFTTVLAQAVAANILDGMGLPGADRAYAKLMKMIENVSTLLGPRVEGELKTVPTPDWI